MMNVLIICKMLIVLTLLVLIRVNVEVVIPGMVMCAQVKIIIQNNMYS